VGSQRGAGRQPFGHADVDLVEGLARRAGAHDRREVGPAHGQVGGVSNHDRSLSRI
jgi:hypothetical protein